MLFTEGSFFLFFLPSAIFSSPPQATRSFKSNTHFHFTFRCKNIRTRPPRKMNFADNFTRSLFFPPFFVHAYALPTTPKIFTFMAHRSFGHISNLFFFFIASLSSIWCPPIPPNFAKKTVYVCPQNLLFFLPYLGGVFPPVFNNKRKRRVQRISIFANVFSALKTKTS